MRWMMGLSAVVIGALLVICAVLASRAAALESRLALREQNVAAYQEALRAVAATGKVRSADLAPHLSADEIPHDGGVGWVVSPGADADLTGFPEISLEFGLDGVLTGAYGYKP